MKKARKKMKPAPAEKIAQAAERGKDVSGFFTKSGRMMKPKDSPLGGKQRESRFGQTSPSE